jgi:hypothetical protein
MKTSLAIMIISAAFLGGCSRANTAAINAWGQKHVVTLYSGGQIVGQWETTGKIEDEDKGDGRYFQDDKTGKLISISGTYVITVK